MFASLHDGHGRWVSSTQLSRDISEFNFKFPHLTLYDHVFVGLSKYNPRARELFRFEGFHLFY
jgi:hypothetical protein